jgi:hypothetical protein
VVNETFPLTILGRDEAVALAVVKPLHSAGCTHEEGSFHI